MKIQFLTTAKKFFPCFSMTEMLDMEMEVVETIQNETHGTMYRVKSGRCIPADLCREVSG